MRPQWVIHYTYDVYFNTCNRYNRDIYIKDIGPRGGVKTTTQLRKAKRFHNRESVDEFCEKHHEVIVNKLGGYNILEAEFPPHMNYMIG